MKGKMNFRYQADVNNKIKKAYLVQLIHGLKISGNYKR